MLKGQTLAPSSMVTSPITWAAMSTNASGCTFGVRPVTERIMLVRSPALAPLANPSCTPSARLRLRLAKHLARAERVDLGGGVADAGEHGVGVGAQERR